MKEEVKNYTEELAKEFCKFIEIDPICHNLPEVLSDEEYSSFTNDLKSGVRTIMTPE